MTEEEFQKIKQKSHEDPIQLYPLTIVADRYGGVYSGAKYLAFNLDPQLIPAAISGGDPCEMNFWDDFNAQKESERILIGRGPEPLSALIDLHNKFLVRFPKYRDQFWRIGEPKKNSGAI